MHVESVAWIAERKNTLSLFFSLASLLAWQRFIAPGRSARSRWYAFSLALYALALASKVTACTLPAAQLLMLWLRGAPIDRRARKSAIGAQHIGRMLGDPPLRHDALVEALDRRCDR